MHCYHDVSTSEMKNPFNILIILGLITSCSTNSTTKLDSDDYENKKDRIDKLEMEIKAFSDFQDAEFELFNVNGFHDQRIAVPGTSSWDYKFVIKVDTIDIPKWISGMKEVELTGYDDSWTKEITKDRNQNWKTSSKPKYFVRNEEDMTMIVFGNEGIIFKRVINL